VNSLMDLVLGENEKYTAKIFEQAQKLNLFPSTSILLEYVPSTGLVCFQTEFVAPLYPYGQHSFDLPPGNKYKLLMESLEYICTIPMDVLMKSLGLALGWNVSGLKIVFHNQSKYRAYEKSFSEKMIYVFESDRNANQENIRRDVGDSSVLFDIFQQKYEEVMRLAKTEWENKVIEYNKLKDTLNDDQKKQYKEYFIDCKKKVHDTLELIDFKYTLYHNRWQELRLLKDFDKDNFHDIPHLENLNDEQITDVLLGRAVEEEKEFTKVLEKIKESLNRVASITSVCNDLGVKPRYYPLNMTRKMNVKELLNPHKVDLLIGPIKKRDRGLVKVGETKDKTTALLDTLRATIKCRDPVVPLIVIEYLQNHGMLTRVKNKTAPTEPYKAVHINFCLGNKPRTIYELQIVFQEYYDLQKKDHDYYEIIRTFH